MSQVEEDEQRRWLGAHDALEAAVGFSSVARTAMEELVSGEDHSGDHPIFSSLELCEILGALDIKGDAFGRLFQKCGTAQGLRAVGFGVSRGSLPIHKVRDASLGLPVDLEIPRLLSELETAGAIG